MKHKAQNKKWVVSNWQGAQAKIKFKIILTVSVGYKAYATGAPP